MTPAEALAVLQAIRPMIGIAPVVGVTGLDGNIGQIAVQGPMGVLNVALELVGPLPLEPDVLSGLAARAEAAMHDALRQFEGEAGRGFNDAGRGSLTVGSPGFSANDGWV
jgi:hypothetical protein